MFRIKHLVLFKPVVYVYCALVGSYFAGYVWKNIQLRKQAQLLVVINFVMDAGEVCLSTQCLAFNCLCFND